MAIYFVSQGGSNTAPYDTWAKAATSLQTALTAASTAGDVVVLDAGNPPTADKEVAVDTTYTFAANNVTLIASTNSGTSTITATTMGTSQWIGNSTTNRSITFAVGATARQIFVYGITIRTAGTTSDSINCNTTAGGSISFSNVYFWQGNTSASSGINTASTTGLQSYVRLENCILRFGNTGQSVVTGAGENEFINCVISTDGSAPTEIFDTPAVAGGVYIFAEGCDWSHAGSGAIMADTTTANVTAVMSRCKLGTGFTALQPQTEGLASASLLLLDCAVGDTHGLFGYYDGLGSCVTDTAITYTGSPAGQSWKIVTSSLASGVMPFRTPFVDFYNTTLSSQTPRFEILRDGSTTAYTDAEVWGEWEVKATSGTVLSTQYSDRQSFSAFASGTAGTSQDAGAGLTAWTGESGTAWSGKIDTGGAVVPAEVGEIRGRICVGLASATVYVDPVVRT